ncbi:hypothetical protein LINPERPRIM_LOCUS22157 [Linum perenne]
MMFLGQIIYIRGNRNLINNVYMLVVSIKSTLLILFRLWISNWFMY